ncbi:PocR ligand-binding domain-containing protein [Desulfonema magnum]|uniref:PocR domain-containing protein n=1 Tax=Desulfonema magnum TaxID=45655 RepID=A0A975BPQ5_9BACT|nr:PocR ligand-binding domain-containing protein [Desulfonema magnum]QTA88914.1 PocR domain-containing protein [Desulfonema magnum]
MELTDILSIEKWTEFEKDIVGRSRLDASVFNTDGIRITNFRQLANRLCPEVKATDRGQSFICAVAHMNLAAQAMQTKKPVIEECDAGLLKLVVPIFVKDEFVGAVGACGFLLDDGEIDSFMVNKTTDIPEEKIESLSEGIETISTEKAESLAAYIQKQLDNFVNDFEKQQ